MIVVPSTEEAVRQVARALQSLGIALDNHETRIQENGGLIEEVLVILYDIDQRVKKIADHVGIEDETIMEKVVDDDGASD